jgi:murein DD-endopeptidase MepM/ murein hydrolase activator NlpD
MSLWNPAAPALKPLLLWGLLATVGFGVLETAGTPNPQPEVARHRTTPAADVGSTPGAPSFASLVDSLSGSIDQLANVPSILPTLGRISSSYSLARYHPLLHVIRPHQGLDIAAPSGTPVVAPAAGVVRFVGLRAGYGLTVEVEHDHGVVTLYGHLSRAFVRDRQSIVRGQHVANVGSSGLSTGPHLHYEILIGGTPVDPLTFGP